MKNKRHRNSTQKNYRGIWKNFNEFFIRLDTKPETWEERIILFVGFLINNNRKSTTIKSYVSAIRAILQEGGVTINQNQFLMSSLTRACRLVNDRVITRLPIRRSMLHILLDRLMSIFSDQPYLNKLYRALFSTAYFGLFRVGEITTGSHPVLAKDVHIADNKNKILFVLRTSKTHGKNTRPQMVKITSRRIDGTITEQEEECDPYCPYIILKEYLQIRGPFVELTEPFFVFSDRSPVAPQHMRKCLKSTLRIAGFDERFYGTAGFRSGRASDLLIVCKLPISSIKKIGRWSSNAVYRYLKC